MIYALKGTCRFESRSLRQPLLDSLSVPLIPVEPINLRPNCRDLGTFGESKLAVDVQSIERPQYFSRLDREVHFGADLQICLLASVGWSGGEAPRDRKFVVEVVGKNPFAERYCNSPRIKPTGQEFLWGTNKCFVISPSR
jgi:hypothetical protein